jgi:hypothetical protein
MPVYQDIAPPVPITFEAEAAVVLNRMVKIGTGSNKVVPIAGVTDRAIGVAVESADPAVGNSAASVWPFNRGGIVPMEAAAAIAVNVKVAPSTNGRAQTAVVTQFAVGTALKAAGGAGEIIPVLVAVDDQAT